MIKLFRHKIFGLLCLPALIRAGVVFQASFEMTTEATDGVYGYPDVFVNNSKNLCRIEYGEGIRGKCVILDWQDGPPGLTYTAGHVFNPTGGTLSIWLRQDKPFHINYQYPRIWGFEGPLVEGLFGDRTLVRSALPLVAMNNLANAADNIGVWRHHALVWNKAAGKRWQYLDGKLVREGVYKPVPPAGFPGNTPGQWPFRIAYRWRGAIDELLVMDDALEAGEVAALFEKYISGDSLFPDLAIGNPHLYPQPTTGKVPEIKDGLEPVTIKIEVPDGDNELRWHRDLAGGWRTRLELASGDPGNVGEGGWFVTDVPTAWKNTRVNIPVLRNEEGGKLLLNELCKDGRVQGIWFEIDVDISTDLKERMVVFRIPWIEAEPEPVYARDFADLYVNGRHASTFALPGGSTLPINHLVKFGGLNRFSLRIGRPYGGISRAASKMQLPAGLAEAPVIEFRKTRDVFAGEPLVTPVTREGKLRIRLPVTNLSPKREKLETTVILVKRDGGGAFRKTAATVVLPVGFNDEIELVVDSDDLEYWFPDDPQLYQLQVEFTKKGRAVDSTTPVRFGYRQLWAENGEFILNGRRLLVRGASHNYLHSYGFTSREIALRKQVGQNSDRTWAPTRRQLSSLNQCDEEGWLVWFTADPAIDKELCHQVWNHPSVVAWCLAGDGEITGPHGHPLSLAAEIPDGGDADANGLAKAERTRLADPGRINGWYRSGVGGDFRSIMHYLGWGTPLQQIEEWLSDWQKNRHEPFLPLEISLIMAPQEYTVWQRNRLHSVLTEHAARYLGDEAYAMTDQKLVELTAQKLPENTPNAGIAIVLEQHPLHLRMRSWFYERVLRSWRLSGSNGWLLHQDGRLQYTHDGNRLNAIGETFARVNDDVLFYIAGPEGNRLAKDHAFEAGEAIEKSLVVFNDSFADSLTGTLTWSVEDGDTVSEEITVAQGDKTVLAARFVAPEVADKKALRLQAEFVSQDGEIRQSDSFDLQIYPRRKTAEWKGGKVALIDTHGDTEAALEQLQIPYVLINQDIIDRGQTLMGFNLIVIGRNSYPEAVSLMQEGFLQLEGAVEAGANLIVLSQQARAVMGLRVENFNSRHVFIRDRQSPLFDGLDNADFCDWRGASSSLPAYDGWNKDSNWQNGRASKHGQWNSFGQLRNWHWSNNGMVATFCFAKPQFGNFRVLLDNGFDCLYTPLLEFRMGRGLVLLSQLELVPNIGEDPVATLLLERILRCYGVEKREMPGMRAIGCLGEDADRMALQELRVEYKPGYEEPNFFLTGDQFVNLSAERSERTAKFVRDGGTLITRLPAGGNTPQWLGFASQAQKAPIGKMSVPGHALFAGLGTGDFFWHWGYNADLIDGEVFVEVTCGKGRVLLFQMPPGFFGAEETNWQQDKLLRIQATMLANLGVKSKVKPDFCAIAGGADNSDWLLGNRPEAIPEDIFCGDDKLYYKEPLDFDPDEHHVW